MSFASSFLSPRFGTQSVPGSPLNGNGNGNVSSSSPPSDKSQVPSPMRALPPATDQFESTQNLQQNVQQNIEESQDAAASNPITPQNPSPEQTTESPQSDPNPIRWTKQDFKAAHAVFWKTVFPNVLGFGAIASIPMLIGIPLALASIPVCWMTNKFGDSLLNKVDPGQLSRSGRHLYELGKFNEDFFKNPQEIERAKNLWNSVVDDAFELPGMKFVKNLPFIHGSKDRLKIHNVAWLRQIVVGASEARGLDKYYLSTLPMAMSKAKTPLGGALTFIKHMAIIGLVKLSYFIGTALDKFADALPGSLKIPFKVAAKFIKDLNYLPAQWAGVRTAAMIFMGNASPQANGTAPSGTPAVKTVA